MIIEILINRPYLVYLPPAVVSQGRIVAATSSVAQIPDQGLIMMMILTMMTMMMMVMTMVVMTMTMTMMKYLMILSSGGKML